MFQAKKSLILLSIFLVFFLAACDQASPFDLDATIAARITPMPAIFQTSIPANTRPPSASATQVSTKTPVPESTSSAGLAADSTETPANPDSPTPVGTPTVDPNKLQGTTVQFWHPWTGPLAQTVQELAQSFNQSNELGIQVEVSSPGSLETLSTAVQDAIKAGQPPDLAAAYLFQAMDWNTNRPLVDLNPYIENAEWGLKPEEQADFLPSVWNGGSNGEQRLSVPALRSAQILYYNQSWAQELGFSSPPVTPAELEKQACAAAQANKQDGNKDNDGTGGLILSTDYSPVLGWIEAFGGEVFDAGKATGKSSPYNFAQPPVSQAFTFLRQLYDKGCAWLPQEPYPEGEFAGRRGLFYVGSVTNLDYLSQVMKQAQNSDQWTVLPLPSPDGKPAIDVYGPDMVVFSSTPEKQLAAWLFARWLLSPPNQARLAQAGSSFPVRQSALEEIKNSGAVQPGWEAAQQIFQYAQAEPGARSWNKVRWAVSDAATQLFRSYFSVDKVPELVKLLNQTAADLNTSP